MKIMQKEFQDESVKKENNSNLAEIQNNNKQGQSLKKNIYFIVVSIISMFTIICLMLWVSHMFASTSPKISYFLILIHELLVLICGNIFIYNSISIVRILTRVYYPEQIFLRTLIKDFIAIVSWMISAFLVFLFPNVKSILQIVKNENYKISDFFNEFLSPLQDTNNPNNEDFGSDNKIGNQNNENANIGNLNDYLGTYKNYFEKRALFAFILILGIFLIKDLILFGLNYNLHYKYYQNRIIQNTEKINILKMLNEQVKVLYSENIEKITDKLLNLISKNGSTITYPDLLEYFKEPVARRIYELILADDEDAIEITKEDLRRFYYQTLVEQQKIIKSLEEKDKSVKEFKTILNIIVIPATVILFPALLMSNSENSFFDFKVIATIIFSTSYSFSDTIKKFISSIHFIFLIRPYELDDVIMLENKAYKVVAIHLMTTVLLHKNKIEMFPNEFLASKPIVNLRIRKIWDEKYTYLFDLDKFESMKDAFLENLSRMIKKYPGEYKKRPYFTDMSLIDKKKISVTLVVGFNLASADLEVIREYKNTFLFRMKQVYQETGLIPYDLNH